MAKSGAQLDHLLHEQELLVLDGQEALLEAVVVVLDVVLLSLEALDLLPLALSRGLSGGAVAKDSLDAALLLLIIGLGSLSESSS